MKRVKKIGYIWALLAAMLFITSVCANVNVYADTDVDIVIDNTQQTDTTDNDTAGNTENEISEQDIITITDTETQKEFRAVWIAYYDYNDIEEKDKESFTKAIGEMFDNVAAMGMNAVVVHVRPFSDAMYKSKYYPCHFMHRESRGLTPDTIL